MRVVLAGPPEVRFTPSGKRLARIYVRDMPGVSIRMWDDERDAYFEQLAALDGGETLDLAGRWSTWINREGRALAQFTVTHFKEVAL